MAELPAKTRPAIGVQSGGLPAIGNKVTPRWVIISDINADSKSNVTLALVRCEAVELEVESEMGLSINRIGLVPQRKVTGSSGQAVDRRVTGE